MRGAYSLPLREFLGLKHKQEHQQKRELSQPFNPAAKPGGSYKRPSRRPPGGQSQLRLKHGEMDTFTADLISWVAGGCQPLAWETLVARKDELEAPTWLDGEILGLDSISHKVLALSLAHLVHLQGGLDNSPFEPGQDLDGGYLIQVLNLSSPHGVWELAKRLGTDSPLRTRGYLEVDREWSTRQKRNGSSPIMERHLGPITWCNFNDLETGQSLGIFYRDLCEAIDKEILLDLLARAGESSMVELSTEAITSPEEAEE